MPIITQVPVAITLHSSAQVSALPLLDKVQQLRHGPNEGQQPVVWHCGSVSHRVWAAGCSTVQLHLSSIISQGSPNEGSFLRVVTLLLLLFLLLLLLLLLPVSHSIPTDTVSSFLSSNS